MKTTNGSTTRSRMPLLLAALFLTACGPDADGPASLDTADPDLGRTVLTLHTPHSDDGGVLLEIRGPAVEEVAALDPAHTVLVREDDAREGVFRLAVLGHDLGGPLVRLLGPEVTARAEAWSIRVLEAVDESDEARPTLQGYRVSVAPPGP